MKIKLFVILMLNLNLLSCVDKFSSELWQGIELPQIEGASIMIDTEKLTSKQLTVTQDLSYPDNSIFDIYDDYFISNNWVKCKNSVDNDWHSFIDASGLEEIRVFQRINYYINYSKKLIGVIYVRYLSKNLHDDSVPDNDTQDATVLFTYSLNVTKEFEPLGIMCDKKL